MDSTSDHSQKKEQQTKQESIHEEEREQKEHEPPIKKSKMESNDAEMGVDEEVIDVVNHEWIFPAPFTEDLFSYEEQEVDFDEVLVGEKNIVEEVVEDEEDDEVDDEEEDDEEEDEEKEDKEEDEDEEEEDEEEDEKEDEKEDEYEEEEEDEEECEVEEEYQLEAHLAQTDEFTMLNVWRQLLEGTTSTLNNLEDWLHYISNGMVEAMGTLFDEDDIIMTKEPEILLSEFGCLGGNGLLYDSVVEKYFNLITKQSQQGGWRFKKSYALSPHAWTLKEQIGDVDVYPEGVNLLDYELVLIPVCKNEHWTLTIFDMDSMKILIINSLEMDFHNPDEELMKSFFAEELQKRGEAIEAEDIPVENVNCPKQDNYYDCGVFVCEFARRLVRGESLEPDSFTQEDVTNYYRPKMVVEILEDCLYD